MCHLINAQMRDMYLCVVERAGKVKYKVQTIRWLTEVMPLIEYCQQNS